MADAVDTIVLSNNPNRIVCRFTNISDGTGETGVVKIDKSTLVGLFGVEPAKLNIEYIQWSIQGFSYVSILWDHTTDDEAAVLAAGNGFRDFREAGVLVDPGSAGGTGDILFTTGSPAPGATYDIEISVKKSGAV